MSGVTQQQWNVHIIGAGVVGRSIAADHINAGFTVELIDVDRNVLRHSVDWITRETKCGVSPLEAWGLDGANAFLSKSDPVPVPNGRDIVIESIIEKREPKKQLFAAMEQAFPSKAILATNTSTIPLVQITEMVQRKDRCCGLHFFMPVEQRPLIEIIRSEATSATTVESAIEYADALGKGHLVVDDSPGFVVNRMLVPYLSESLHLLCTGATAQQIELAAKDVGMPMSPLELMDWIGMETNFHAGRAIWQARPSRIEPSALMPAMVKAGRDGRRNGAGFYDYIDGERSKGLAQESVRLIDDYSRHAREWTVSEVAHRLFVPMLLEGAFILRENVVPDAQSIELAMRDGLGFRRNGGFLGYFENMGSDKCQRLLTEYETIGRRYRTPEGFKEAIAELNSVAAAMKA